MGTTLTIRVPGDYLLTRDVCSYGYFLLAPNHWDPSTQTLARVLNLDAGPVSLRIAQPGGGSGSSLRVHTNRTLDRPEQNVVRRLLGHMLRLDEDEETIRAFHRVDPRWRRSGRGRLFRSPTLFEDVVKTVTSCNVQWPGTVQMNRRLCEVVGRGGAFPTPARLARTRASTLRGRCRVGYRDARLIELARIFRSGQMDWIEDPDADAERVHAALLDLPGVGPYGAANIMQLIGRYDRLPLDTESLRHGRNVLGYTGSDRQVLKRVVAHYEAFGEHMFRSYWFEMWSHYESKQGPAHTWERESTASAFTASKL